MGTHSSLLHFLHDKLILRRLQVHEQRDSFPCHDYTVRVQIPIALPFPAPVELIQARTDLPEPLKEDPLFYHRMIP